jgi:hypothetical protein
MTMVKLLITIKCTFSAICFDGHGSPPVQYKAHRLVQHVQGYSGSHWMPPPSNYLLRIAPAAARATGKQTTINKYTKRNGHFDGRGGAYNTACIAQLRRLRAMLEATKRCHQASIAADRCNWSSLPCFFQVSSSSTCKKRSRVNAKAPVFNRVITYQTKKKGLIMVSI